MRRGSSFSWPSFVTISAANSGTTAMSRPAVELLRRVSAWPSNHHGRLISMSVKASSHFHRAKAGASALRCNANGSSSSAPSTVREPATTSGSISPTAMRMSR